MIDPDRDWIQTEPDACGCGLEDCELAGFDYYYCACGEHHRLPVAKSGPCPVDVNAAMLDEADRRGEGSISDATRSAVLASFTA